MAMLARAISLDDRIKGSGLFPRIRDAEREMVRNEQEFRRNREKERKRKEKQKKYDAKTAALNPDSKQQIVQTTNYFTAFVLTKDPDASQYMTFDEVYYPKLFFDTTKHSPPESLQQLWVLGFQDHTQRTAMQPPKKHSSLDEDMSTVITLPTLDPKVKQTENSIVSFRKNARHKFQSIYNAKPLVTST